VDDGLEQQGLPVDFQDGGLKPEVVEIGRFFHRTRAVSIFLDSLDSLDRRIREYVASDPIGR
jgi:hypothetical protein